MLLPNRCANRRRRLADGPVSSPRSACNGSHVVRPGKTAQCRGHKNGSDAGWTGARYRNSAWIAPESRLSVTMNAESNRQLLNPVSLRFVNLLVKRALSSSHVCDTCVVFLVHEGSAHRGSYIWIPTNARETAVPGVGIGKPLPIGLRTGQYFSATSSTV